jgi:hypothetical protein
VLSGEGRRSACLALAPALVSLCSSAIALLVAALGGSTNQVEYCLFGIYAALVLAVCGILTIIYLPGRDKLLWCFLALALALLGIAIGVAIWAQAIGVSCHNGTSCPFG